MVKEDKAEQPKCSKCGSRYGYCRIGKKIFVCRACGSETKFSWKGKEENDKNKMQEL